MTTAWPAPRRRRPERELLALALVLALGLGLATGVLVRSARAGGGEAGAQAPTASQPAPVTSLVVRPMATPACLEAAERGDRLVHLLIQNKREQASKLLVPYHVASRQCAKDGDPAHVRG